MIGIINYQGGNLNNVVRAFNKFGFETKVLEEVEDTSALSGLVLPGVGAFELAMSNLKSSGFDRLIKDYVKSGKPLLGICLGLQLLFEESLEFGRSEGLGILKGKVLPFEIKEKVPHMGWNQVSFQKESHFLKSVKNEEHFYFVHSFYVVPEDSSIVLATTHYGIDFVSMVEKDNIIASQFHPEKSQEKGLQIIKDFGEFCANYSGN